MVLFNADLILKSKVAVHCCTKEKAINLLSWANSLGETWDSGDSYLKLDNWGRYEENTCYNINSGRYASIATYNDLSYTILEYDDVLLDQSLLRRIYD